MKKTTSIIISICQIKYTKVFPNFGQFENTRYTPKGYLIHVRHVPDTDTCLAFVLTRGGPVLHDLACEQVQVHVHGMQAACGMRGWIILIILLVALIYIIIGSCIHTCNHNTYRTCTYKHCKCQEPTLSGSVRICTYEWQRYQICSNKLLNYRFTV